MIYRTYSVDPLVSIESNMLSSQYMVIGMLFNIYINNTYWW